MDEKTKLAIDLGGVIFNNTIESLRAENATQAERIAELEQDLHTTADALAEVEQIRLGLENVRLFAARHRKEDWALMILGFCAEAGVVGSITR